MPKEQRQSEETHFFSVGADNAGERLDVFLSTHIPDMSRSFGAQLARLGLVQVNGGPSKAGARLHTGDTVHCSVPPSPGPPQPEALPLDIVYRDADVLVVNKPAGMVVHPAPGHEAKTLVNAVLALCPGLVGGQSDRPGIVHRIDKDTSGLLAVALNAQTYKWLVAQFKTREVKKEYVAMVAGRLPPSGVIDAPIGRHPTKRKRMAIVPGGRSSITEYELLEELGEVSLVLARPLTGRTHQIRVHMESIGHPVVGDPVYGGRNHRRLLRGVVPRQFLHAQRLAFRLASWSSPREFFAPLPTDLLQALETARTTAVT